MPKLDNAIPKLCRHARGAAFVKIAGQQIWFGRYGEPATKEKYDRFIGEWLANGRQLPPQEMNDQPNLLKVSELVDRFRQWAEQRYGPRRVHAFRTSIRLVRQMYGGLPAVEFGPKCLRAVRATMVAGDPNGDPPRRPWTRRNINRQVGWIRAMFKWGGAHELIPETVYRRLALVEPLSRGEAPERPRVTIVERADVRKVRPFVSRQVRAIVDLQLLTGARCDELVRLRALDIDTQNTGKVWVYTPTDHKTAHHDKDRVIYFGPKAQRILKMFMVPERPLDAFLFSPREAERERHDQATTHRRPNQKPNPKLGDREIGEHYTTTSVRRAIHRACAKSKANVPLWSPHRLRHNAATFIAREFGIEMARIILGHSKLDTTAIYAEQDRRKAAEVMRKIG